MLARPKIRMKLSSAITSLLLVITANYITLLVLLPKIFDPKKQILIIKCLDAEPA
jgi:hypothetical protein